MSCEEREGPAPAPTLTDATDTGSSQPAVSDANERAGIDRKARAGSADDVDIKDAHHGSTAVEAVPKPRRPGWLWRTGVFVLLLAVCVPVVALYIQRNRPLFIVDEFAYADYLYKVHSGQPFVRRGEVHEQETLRALACRGYEPEIWPVRPACDSPTFDPAEFPNAGINLADIHPPTYFVITDLGSRVILALGVTDDLIQAGRLFGAAWLAAGLLALWCLMRYIGVNRWATALCLGLVTASPSLRWQWHYLTPDAANLLVGSLVVLAALRWERTGRGLVLLAGAGALALGFKAPNLIVVVAAAAYLAVRAVIARQQTGVAEDGRDRRTPREYVKASASLLVGGGVVAAIWLAVRAAIAVPGVTAAFEATIKVDGLRASYFFENVGRFITVWDVAGSKSYPLALIVSYVLIGSLLAAVASLSPTQPRHTLALVTGGLVMVGPLLLVVVTYITSGTYFMVEPRYGASLVPVQAMIAASFWRTRAALIAVGGLVVIYQASVLLLLLNE